MKLGDVVDPCVLCGKSARPGGFMLCEACWAKASGGKEWPLSHALFPSERTMIAHYWQTPLYPHTRCFILADELIPLFEQVFQQAGITLKWREDAWRGFFGDEERLRQAMKELHDCIDPHHQLHGLFAVEVIELATKKLRGL